MSWLRRLAVLAWCVSLAAQADVVQLQNGDRITGEVESLDGSALRISTEWGGTVRIERGKIASIETDRELNLAMDEGERRTGRLVTDPSGDQKVETDRAREPLDLAQVQLASIERLPGSVNERWENRLTYGLNISSGNTETESHSLRANTLLRQTEFRHTANAEADIRKDDGATSREAYGLGYQLDWFFQQDWYAFGSANYFQDKLRDIDFRVTLGAGVGYQVWENSLGGLSIEAGASEVIEKIGGERETNAAARWSTTYNRHLFGHRLEAFHNHELLVLTDRDRGEIIKTSTGLRYSLNSFLSADARVDLDYETEPAVTRKNTDITYILGVGVNW